MEYWEGGQNQDGSGNTRLSFFTPPCVVPRFSSADEFAKLGVIGPTVCNGVPHVFLKCGFLGRAFELKQHLSQGFTKKPHLQVQVVGKAGVSLSGEMIFRPMQCFLYGRTHSVFVHERIRMAW